jgi:death-on-curing protein
MTTLKLTQIGNSLGLILPREVLARLKLQKGDTVFVTDAANGVMLTPYDPDLDQQLEIGREFMHEYRDTFHQARQVSWRWLDRRALELLHDESLAEHGGASGLRDEGLLESALARPLNLAAYGQPDVADLAAAYGVGLARNHPFIDGNKRVAFLAVGLFLALNGRRLVTSQADATLTVLAVASGQIDEATFARWVREHSAPRHT